jgi:hypothetical protein
MKPSFSAGFSRPLAEAAGFVGASPPLPQPATAMLAINAATIARRLKNFRPLM